MFAAFPLCSSVFAPLPPPLSGCKLFAPSKRTRHIFHLDLQCNEKGSVTVGKYGKHKGIKTICAG